MDPASPEARDPAVGPAAKVFARGGYFGRYLVSGAANTLATYALYLLLLAPLGHRLAYTIAFAAGLGLAYVLNRAFVFRSHAGWRSVAAIPLVYLVQFVLGVAIIEAWVAWLQWPPALAPLGAIAITVPITFVLSRKAFMRWL